MQGCIQDFGSGGGGGRANWAIKKCRRGEVIRIIAVQMNLPDPRGANYPPRRYTIRYTCKVQIVNKFH